jgi:TRAP-type uncharacterized transport system substrate-binding protein
MAQTREHDAMVDPVHVRFLGATPNWLKISALVASGLIDGGGLPTGSTAGAIRSAVADSGPALVGAGQYDVSLAKSVTSVRMAGAGTGLFSEPLALRTLAVLPMDDRLLLVVRRDAGISTMEDFVRADRPLRVATPDPSGSHPVLEFIKQVLELHGTSWADLQSRGVTLDTSRPATWDEADLPDAVFDAAIMTSRWEQIFASGEYRALALSAHARGGLIEMGHRFAPLPSNYVLEPHIDHLDVSGWPLFCHESMSDRLAYLTVEALARQAQAIFDITDEAISAPIDMSVAGQDTGVPLHPGAKAWFSEHGYRTHDV